MSMSDPIAGHADPHPQCQMVGHVEVSMPASKLKASIAKVLKGRGLHRGFRAARKTASRKSCAIGLKYYAGKP